jgi:hypothetical protein
MTPAARSGISASIATAESTIMTDHVTAPTSGDIRASAMMPTPAGSGARFLCLIAACFVIARRASTLGQRGWVGRSIPGHRRDLPRRLRGSASGASTPEAVLGFWGAVAVGWAWIAVLSARLTLGEPYAPVDPSNLGHLTIGEQP